MNATTVKSSKDEMTGGIHEFIHTVTEPEKRTRVRERETHTHTFTQKHRDRDKGRDRNREPLIQTKETAKPKTDTCTHAQDIT